MSFSHGKVTGKNTPYLVQEDLRELFSRNKDDYKKCQNCARITYFKKDVCTSCKKSYPKPVELGRTGYVKCPICNKRWKRRESDSCQPCRTKIMQLRATQNGR